MNKSYRIDSIDLLRGIVMILMALDHVRDYFHADAFLYNPLDLTQTSVPLFFTRWITHFCAPVFVFLAGTSSFLVGERKSKKELSFFLVKRGIWLIVLELTIINFAWFYNISFSLIILVVIWVLGVGMLVLAAAIHLRYYVVMVLGFALVFGHNLLDGIYVDGNNADAIGWTMLHGFKAFPVTDHFTLFAGYAILPWTGIMLLGYCFGKLFTPAFQERREKILLSIGGGLILLFVILRLPNIYGDPSPWSVQSTTIDTILSFINVSKYPPSLLYTLITLGPAIIFLSQADKLNFNSWFNRMAWTLGKVPMFYYVLHLYLIHSLAVAAALLTGYDLNDMVFTTWVTDSPNLKGYGFNLWIVYAVWIFVVLSLYPLCKWFAKYKADHREKWWLSYL
ncbi:DUF1624 domain-containing protein [Pseudochryseolinea flava]|uniref:Heparan-alpha-glucosaminide N-acetyltransferase catalytic domain-containing protein n=1 Tax=Pseudochryseolinea flava TaxID=2059302 RepID=A0A364Y2V4_9BACT|nr:heparan-alpha-glucosaminide N-acetyltransferase domain-containing protein [Pseudochryseolinea flava]RAW00106.1 hypothetical protein DQQ10_16280 [Pseudochryseolinea flava]